MRWSLTSNDSDATPFCPDSLWDSSVSWNTGNPNLTECFRFTVLASLPPAVLLLHLPHYAVDLRRRWQSRSLFADERAGGGALHWVRWDARKGQKVGLAETIEPLLPSRYRTILALLVAISSFTKFLSDTAFGSDVFPSDLFRVAAVSIAACATIVPAQMDRHFLK